MIGIYYTGTLITPNGSDVSIYGDGCEEGTGADMENGWVDPRWSRSTVYENREDVRPDEWTPEDGPLIDWLIDRITERLGWVDSPTSADWFAGTEDVNGDPYTGVSLTLDAHLENVPPAVAAAVRYGIAHRQARR